MLALVFDWETTGLTLHESAPLEDQPRALEFGGVLINEGGEFVERVGIIINPGIPLDADITRITGLTDADVIDAPRIDVVIPQLRRLFSEAQLAIAHNLGFDKSILKFELARLGITDFPWPERELCTVQAHAPLWGRRPKLKELYLHVLDRPLGQTHRALDDATALAEIVVALGLHRPEEAEG